MSPVIAFFTDPMPAHALARLRYVLDFLERHPNSPSGLRCLLNPTDLPTHGRVCRYGALKKTLERTIFIPARQKLLNADPKNRQDAHIVSYHFNKNTIYAVEMKPDKTNQDFFASGAFGFDWIETLFFQLSRMEEYAPATYVLDEAGMMKSNFQLFSKQGLHHIPTVDRLVLAVHEALGFKQIPQPTRFTLSHDIDSLQIFGPEFRLLRYLGGVALRHRTVRNWPRIISDYRRVCRGMQPDPGDTFDRLLTLSNKVSKTIYFGFGNHSRYDHFPALNSPRLLEVRQKALDLGYEIGIHPSFNTWKDARLFQEELQTAEKWLGRQVYKSRQHYLHFAFPETADILAQHGIREDASLGFRDRVGFRAGTGFPFHLYCFETESPYDWEENPLVAMDCGMVREWGRGGATLKESWDRFIAQNSTGTAVSINLHNTFLYEQAIHGVDFGDLIESVLNRTNN